MNILLDTHALIWFGRRDPQLLNKARSIIENPTNSLMVSIVSFYEIAIKINIGKFELGKPLRIFYADTLANQIQILPITETHLSAYISLPIFGNHKDPFDRLIIATAFAENASVLSADANFSLYKELVGVEW